MARVSLIDADNRTDLSDLVAKLRTARRGRLINIYRMLLHSPSIAAAWMDFNTAVRNAMQLDGQTRELAILRIAILNKVDYILRAHVSSFAINAGLSAAQIDALEDWRPSALFSSAHRSLLAYVDSMTRDIEVPDSVFSVLREHYSEQQVVEATVLIGAYNMHSRVLRALRIDPEPVPQASSSS